MSLDFFVTQFYRLIVHDLVLMSDVYWFYSQNRLEGKSIQEFSEVNNEFDQCLILCVLKQGVFFHSYRSWRTCWRSNHRTSKKSTQPS